jgi:hypothetical protein
VPSSESPTAAASQASKPVRGSDPDDVPVEDEPVVDVLVGVDEDEPDPVEADVPEVDEPELEEPVFEPLEELEPDDPFAFVDECEPDPPPDPAQPPRGSQYWFWPAEAARPAVGPARASAPMTRSQVIAVRQKRMRPSIASSENLRVGATLIAGAPRGWR